MGLSGISAPIRFVFISDVTSLTRPPPKVGFKTSVRIGSVWRQKQWQNERYFQGKELRSFAFNVQVVDFAFDHFSRQLLSKVTTIILGFGSITMLRVERKNR